MKRSVARQSSAGVVLLAFCLMIVLFAPAALAQPTKTQNADKSDWCFGQTSLSRVEDSSAALSCGKCTAGANEACFEDADCPAGTCAALGTYTETVFWDARTDGAINDLATVAVAQDNVNLYIYAELWVDPDPTSLPFGQFLIDFEPGGTNALHDPLGTMVRAGHCSVTTDRACNDDVDCHFCGDINAAPGDITADFEPPACCEIGVCPPSDLCRVRACGNGCDAGVTCDTSETCIGLGTRATNEAGTNSGPLTAADYNVVFDFSIWVTFGGTQPSANLRKASGSTWPASAEVYLPAVDPGTLGGSGGPPGAVELAIPWSDFGCADWVDNITGCPTAACGCPDFGPEQEFTYNLVISRGETFLDFVPRGVIEDIPSEAVGGVYTRTVNNCAGSGTGNTACEISDGSSDSFLPAFVSSTPGGRARQLLIGKSGGSLELSWTAGCSTADNDYELYRGTIASLPTYDHDQIACSTGGSTSETVATPAADSYFLVVPTDGSGEGSYGRDSGGTERPEAGSTGGTACNPQSIGDCP